MEAMIEDLIEYRLDKIEAAFKRWRKEKEKIPTPAGIIKILSKDKKAKVPKNYKSLADFQGNFEKYKEYAIENGYWLVKS